MDDKNIVEFIFRGKRNYLYYEGESIYASLYHIAMALGYTSEAMIARLNKFTAVKNLSKYITCKLDRQQPYPTHFVPIIKVADLLDGLRFRNRPGIKDLYRAYIEDFATEAEIAVQSCLSSTPLVTEKKVDQVDTLPEHQAAATIEVDVPNITPVIVNGTKALKNAELAQLYDVTPKRLTEVLANNIDQYIEGVHYFRLSRTQFDQLLLNPQKSYYGFVPGYNRNKNDKILWTEKGALLAAKAINTPKAWQALSHIEMILNGTDMVQQSSYGSGIGDAFLKIAGVYEMILNRLDVLEKKIDSIIPTPQPQTKSSSWREKVKAQVRVIKEYYPIKSYDAVWRDLYAELSQIKGCKLSARLNSMRRQAVRNGLPKSKVDKLNYLDVIESDEDLKAALLNLLAQYYQLYVIPMQNPDTEE